MADVSVPHNIIQFYSDWNFTACFSTPSERSQLRLTADLNRDKGLSERLKTVSKRLNRIEIRIQKTDPGMVMNTGVSDPVTAEFVEPISSANERDTIFIRVRVWALSPVYNAILVSFYEKSQKKTPAPDIQQVKQFSLQGHRTEIHTWTRVNGQWMRKEVNVVLIQH